MVGQQVKIALITSIAVPHDAISGAFRRNYLDLSSVEEVELTLFALGSAVPDLPIVTVADVGELLVHPDYCSADVIIFHFGIYYPLFDAVLVGNGRSKIIVIFHNVTPKEHVDEKHHQIIDLSISQARNIAAAHEVWADSDVNRRVLLDLGVVDERIEIVPLAVAFPPMESAQVGPPPGPVQLLFVGRVVRSKGVLEAIAATKAAVARGHRLHFTIAGNLQFSDPDYLDECRARVTEYGLDGVVSFAGTVSPDDLESLYRGAQILMICSYHEGFCVPVVEGLRAGCIPVGFAAGNVPVVAHNLGRLVEPGDVVALSGALIELLDDLELARRGGDGRLRLDRGEMSLREFDMLRREAVAEYEPSVLRSIKVQRIMRLAGPTRSKS